MNRTSLKPNLREYSTLLCEYGNLPEELGIGEPIWKVGLYVKISRYEANSISMSIIKQIKKHAIALRGMNDFMIYDVYIDADLKRTGFSGVDYFRMQEDVKNETINCIIIMDLTRYVRNFADGIKELDKYVREHKIRFISLDIPSIDTLKNPDILLSQEVYQALRVLEDYTKMKTKKVMDIKAIKRADGESNGGFPPYGYLPNPSGKHWLYDPVAGEIVKKMYSWSAEGLSDLAITKKLNSLGIPNPTKYKHSLGLKYINPASRNNSGIWWPSTVKKILEDKTYIGFSVQGKIDYTNNERTIKNMDEYISIPNCHEICVDEELFNQVTEKRKRQSVVKKNGQVHMFAYLVYCSDCGIAMKRTMSGKNEVLYCRTYKYVGKNFCTAKRTIFMSNLSDVVLKAIQQHIVIVSNMKLVVNKINESNEINKESLRINQLIETDNESLENAAHLLETSYFDWKNGDITRDIFLKVKEKVECDQRDLRVSINRLLMERERISKGIDISDEYFTLFLKYLNIETLNRELLVEIIDRIYVHADKSIQVNFKFNDQYLLIIDYLKSNCSEEELDSIFN